MDAITDFAIGTFFVGVVVGINLIILSAIVIKMLVTDKSEE